MGVPSKTAMNCEFDLELYQKGLAFYKLSESAGSVKTVVDGDVMYRADAASRKLLITATSRWVFTPVTRNGWISAIGRTKPLKNYFGKNKAGVAALFSGEYSDANAAAAAAIKQVNHPGRDPFSKAYIRRLRIPNTNAIFIACRGVLPLVPAVMHYAQGYDWTQEERDNPLIMEQALIAFGAPWWSLDGCVVATKSVFFHGITQVESSVLDEFSNFATPVTRKSFSAYGLPGPHTNTKQYRSEILLETKGIQVQYVNTGSIASAGMGLYAKYEDTSVYTPALIGGGDSRIGNSAGVIPSLQYDRDKAPETTEKGMHSLGQWYPSNAQDELVGAGSYESLAANRNSNIAWGDFAANVTVIEHIADLQHVGRIIMAFAPKVSQGVLTANVDVYEETAVFSAAVPSVTQTVTQNRTGPDVPAGAITHVSNVNSSFSLFGPRPVYAGNGVFTPPAAYVSCSASSTHDSASTPYVHSQDTAPDGTIYSTMRMSKAPIYSQLVVHQTLIAPFGVVATAQSSRAYQTDSTIHDESQHAEIFELLGVDSATGITLYARYRAGVDVDVFILHNGAAIQYVSRAMTRETTPEMWSALFSGVTGNSGGCTAGTPDFDGWSNPSFVVGPGITHSTSDATATTNAVAFEPVYGTGFLVVHHFADAGLYVIGAVLDPRHIVDGADPVIGLVMSEAGVLTELRDYYGATDSVYPANILQSIVTGAAEITASTALDVCSEWTAPAAWNTSTARSWPMRDVITGSVV